MNVASSIEGCQPGENHRLDLLARLYRLAAAAAAAQADSILMGHLHIWKTVAEERKKHAYQQQQTTEIMLLL